MSDVISRIKLESNEFDSKIKRATQNLLTMEQECRKVNGTLAVLEKDQLEYVKSLGRMETVSNSARGKIKELTQAFTELSVQYNRLTDEEKNGDYGKALSASLEQLKNRINESKNELNDINKSLNGGGGLSDALNSVAGKLGLSIDQVTKFGGVVGLTTTAVQVCKDAFFNSESNIDEWGRTVKGAEGAYQVFLDTLNNGNWSNFFQNLSLAIQGGRDLYDVFDRLGSIKSNNAAAIAIVQQQIAQLRLAKQQGENVDAQLKAATERLAQLQKQSINAGKTAGTTSAFQTIRNSVNSIGGAGVNDATINYAVTRIMQNGQSEFDRYRYNRDVLRKKGSRTIITPLDDGMGGTVNKYTQQFDINLLTKEEQKQYKLAQAITERETEIQKGIAAYAQAVSEGTASAREQFKGNRYALQGSGSSGGKSRKVGKKNIKEEKDDFEEIIGLIPNAEEAVRSLQQQISESWDEGEIANLTEKLKIAQKELQRLKDIGNEKPMVKGLSGFNQQTMSAWMQGRQGDLSKAEYGSAEYSSIMGNIADMNTIKTILEESMKAGIDAAKFDLSSLWEKVFDGDNIPNSTWQSMVDTINEKLKELKLDPIKIDFQTGNVAKDGKEIAKDWGSAATAISAVGTAMSSIEDPAAKVMGTIAQAIATIALTYAQSLKGTFTPWDWIAGAVSGMATMISAISAIHSATGYASGGIIGGNSFSGDNVPGMVGNTVVGLNSGELILNKSQQNNIASQLTQAGGVGRLVAKLKGRDILISLERELSETGKGQLATWR